VAPTFQAAFECVFLAYAEAAGKPRWGDKTPQYVRHIDVLAKIFPDAQFVHLIRDGRDVACSLLDVPWFEGDVGKAARRWRKGLQRGRKQGRRLGPGRYLELTYESLVEHPEKHLQSICEFLGESFTPDLLSTDADPDHLVPQHRQAWHGQISKPVTRARVGRYRDELSATQIDQFETIAGDLLQEYGYPTHSKHPRGRGLLSWWRAGRARE